MFLLLVLRLVSFRIIFHLKSKEDCCRHLVCLLMPGTKHTKFSAYIVFQLVATQQQQHHFADNGSQYDLAKENVPSKYIWYVEPSVQIRLE